VGEEEEEEAREEEEETREKGVEEDATVRGRETERPQQQQQPCLR